MAFGNLSDHLRQGQKIVNTLGPLIFSSPDRESFDALRVIVQAYVLTWLNHAETDFRKMAEGLPANLPYKSVRHSWKDNSQRINEGFESLLATVNDRRFYSTEHADAVKNLNYGVRMLDALRSDIRDVFAIEA